jgi:hypothetical protein
MVELAYGELKQALICCTVYRDCTGCPLYKKDVISSALAGDPTCTYHLLSAAMNCINVMEKDLADANTRAEKWEEVATKNEKALIELYESLDHGGKNDK